MADNQSKYKLLIVEDNPADMRLFREAIQHSELGMDGLITCAYSGEEAMQALSAADAGPGYDAVILDLNMPRVRGHEVLRSIRSHTALAEVPVFVMTNSDYRRDVDECRELGADGYFQKPSDFDDLIHFFSSMAHVREIHGRIAASDVASNCLLVKRA